VAPGVVASTFRVPDFQRDASMNIAARGVDAYLMGETFLPASPEL